MKTGAACAVAAAAAVTAATTATGAAVRVRGRHVRRCVSDQPHSILIKASLKPAVARRAAATVAAEAEATEAVTSAAAAGEEGVPASAMP